MRNVAIFDIDGTIFRSSLLIELVEVLIEEKIFPVSVRADYAREKVRWLDRNRTYRMTTDLIAELKRKKYFILAISQSPKGILDLFCKELGFDKVYGRFYELGPTDCFTGRVEDEHLIENKAAILRRAVEKEGLTLEASVGVEDTESDIPFLELVENPICFNPNMKLYRHAKRN